MEFTREAWENAPEGARVEYNICADWKPVTLVGFTSIGIPVIESLNGNIWRVASDTLRIILPRRKVTVQLWRHVCGSLYTKCAGGVWNPNASWTLLAEHTFEIEGE